MTAGETLRAPGQVWSCASCSCRLVLHASTFSDPAWFEHDQQSVAREVLMNCVRLDPEVKVEARHRKLRNMLHGLDVPVMTLSRYCVWCSDHYQGVKHFYNRPLTINHHSESPPLLLRPQNIPLVLKA